MIIASFARFASCGEIPMNKLTTIALLALLAASTCAIASDEASAPEAGTYAASIFVDSISSGYCLDSAGAHFAGGVSYGGLSATTDYVRIPITAKSKALVSVQTLTVTSGKGTLRPSGKFTWTGNGFGGGGWSLSGTFQAQITEIGTHAFALQIGETYMNGYGSCMEVLNISLVRMGANQ